jgi:hypothetical protein
MAFALLGLAPLLLLPLTAHAALGDDEASVSTDAVGLKAVHRAAARTAASASAAYTVHELQTTAGTTIHEFVSTAGVVFAVTWKGPFMPDMRLLLGRYFATYANAPRDPASRRSYLSIRRADLVARSSGHMRAFTGLVYVPQLLPAGVDPGDLK